MVLVSLTLNRLKFKFFIRMKHLTSISKFQQQMFSDFIKLKLPLLVKRFHNTRNSKRKKQIPADIQLKNNKGKTKFK